MTAETIGGQLLRLLREYGTTLVFGIPGVHTIELYRGLAGSGLRHITPRHEQAAGFMADGYARISGRPGVCLLITGPGLTNAVTAMAQAYADSVPMLVISAVAPIGVLGRGQGFLHELPDQRGLLRQVTAFSHTVLSAAELPEALARAFALFATARPRPVHIEIPLNLLAAPAAGGAACASLLPPGPHPRALAKAATLCRAARAPVLLAGGGARGAPASLARLAERLDAPTVLTINARGLLPPDHPLAVSVSPTEREVRDLIAAADLVVAIGTELGPTDYDIYDDRGLRLDAPLLRIDIDPEQAMRGTLPDAVMIGDAAACAEALLAALGPRDEATSDGAVRARAVRTSAWARFAAPMRAQVLLLEAVRDTLPGAILVGDSTQLVYAGNTCFAAAGPGSWFNSATGYGTLGYGLPAGIGAALAAPERPVVCLVGDGGLQHSLAELGSAVEAGVAPILLLLDNGGYGEIKASMVRAGVAPVGVDLFTPDFASLARAYGWDAVALEAAAALPAALRAARAARRPTLIAFGPAILAA